mgnify:FL=1
MRKTILLTFMLLLSVLGMQAKLTKWPDRPTKSFPYDAVVYASLVTSDGEPVIMHDSFIGAIIGEELRSLTMGTSYTGSDGVEKMIYTIRIPVGADDANQTVKFAIGDQGAMNFEMAKTITVSGGDQTFGMPSKPIEFVYNPLTDITIKDNLKEITVQKGETINDYLKALVVLNPANADVDIDDIDFYPENTEVVYLTEEGELKAIAVGSSPVGFSYSGPRYARTEVIVKVIDKVPDKDLFEVLQNPLTITLSQSELLKKDIYMQLADNVIVGDNTYALYGDTFNADNLNFEEGSNVKDKILSVEYYTGAAAFQVLAKEYGSTQVEWTYSIKAAGFDADGSFNPEKEYSHSFGFNLNIHPALGAIIANGFVMGLDDEATIKIETEPAGILLDESKLKWDIPMVGSNSQTPIIILGERIAGTNEWKFEPQALNKDKAITVTYDKDYIDTLKIQILQHVELAEGWNWMSLYSDQLYEDQIKTYFSNAQEIRSQHELLYNDPGYGFFGSLANINCGSTYKVNVKEGQSVDFYAPEIQYYTGDAADAKAEYIMSGWQWKSFPYCFRHYVAEVLGKASLPNGSRIISKDGFTECYEGKWAGTLETIVPGEGYLIYNSSEDYLEITWPAESKLTKVERSKAAKRAPSYSPFSYNKTRFADNMTIIAKSDEYLDGERYSVGAYVDGECRGAGRIIDGKMYITVHGEQGDKVAFKLYDKFSGQYIDMNETVGFTPICGSSDRPMSLNAPGTFTGVEEIMADDDFENAEVFTLSGQRVASENIAPGIYIVRGKTSTRKLIIK